MCGIKNYSIQFVVVESIFSRLFTDTCWKAGFRLVLKLMVSAFWTFVMSKRAHLKDPMSKQTGVSKWSKRFVLVLVVISLTAGAAKRWKSFMNFTHSAIISYDEAKWHWRNDCREAQLEACMVTDQAAIFDTMRARTCCSQLQSENMLPCHILAVTRSHARCDFTLCIYPASLQIRHVAKDKVFVQL